MRWATREAGYLAVRDQGSATRLRESGVQQPINIVPDTALEVSRIWSAEELDNAWHTAFASRQCSVPDRYVVFHLNARYMEEGVGATARRLDRICHRLNAVGVLIGIGPCHRDNVLQRKVGRRMRRAALIIDRPHSLREVAACIGRSIAYFGSSLHGMITACSFGVPGVLVASSRGGQQQKFAGFLKQVGLSSSRANTWQEAEAAADLLLRSSAEEQEQLLDRVMPALDRHWERIRQILSDPSQHERPQSLSGDGRRLLVQFECFNREHPGVHPVFGPIVVENAEQVMTAHRRLLAWLGPVPAIAQWLRNTARRLRATFFPISGARSNDSSIPVLQTGSAQHEDLSVRVSGEREDRKVG